MTMLRMLLPWILGSITALIILWFIIYQMINAGLDTEDAKILKKTGKIILYVILLSFGIRVLTMGSVNETPRSVIDRTVPAQMNNDFEERAKRQADSPKNCDSTMKNCQPNKR